MNAILFKTIKLAEVYIAETYPEVAAGKYTTNDITINDSCRVRAVDMPDFSWSGETGATEIVDEDSNTVDVVAAWESGEDVYELYDGEQLVGSFDNYYDARHAQKEAGSAAKLYCNGEDITY